MSREEAATSSADATSPKDIALWLLRRWKPLLACTLFGAVVAAGISMTIPRSYEATATLRPVIFDTSNIYLQGGSTTSGIGGVASSLLGGTRQADDGTVSIAMLSSMDFIKSFIAANNLLPVLYSDQWDAAAGRWKGEVPKLDDLALQNFLRRMTINQDPNGLVDLSIRGSTPAEAEKLERLFISAANKRRRDQTLSRAKANLDYLEKRLGLETTEEMRTMTANLAGKQLAQIMVSQGPGDFAFELVSPPFASHFPVAPARKLIAVMGSIIGFVGAAVFLLIREAWKRAS